MSLSIHVPPFTDLPLNSSKGRAYPDISAQSMDFQVIIGGKEESVDGTSASSPVGCRFSHPHQSHPFNLGPPLDCCCYFLALE